MSFTKIAQYKSVAALRERIAELEIDLPLEDAIRTAAEGSPLAASIEAADVRVGNRWCIHPMEGWDAGRDGSPSERTRRRWRRFGASGAKLIWGGEAAAVQPDGRANPNQTMAVESNREGLRALLDELLGEHGRRYGGTDDLLVGLQLTHSGRYAKPNGPAAEPRIAYHHPILDGRVGVAPGDDATVWSDGDLERLIDAYVAAARLAAEVGFRFVDVKACHGYLLHEFLGARRRAGPFGGDLAGRSRLLTTIVERIGEELPALAVGVRLSVGDTVPFRPGASVGEPEPTDEAFDCGFGLDLADPTRFDLAEPLELVGALLRRGVRLINVTCGSPYYNPHLQRPAAFPPSDGYAPPEDPLVGVARHLATTRAVKQAHPAAIVAGSGFSYLQDYLPHAAQAVAAAGWMDFVGVGRMVLSYPELPHDTLTTGRLQRKLICRTFSDCTTAPRNGLASGCYPLDTYYKALPEFERLRAAKNSRRDAPAS